MQSCGVHLSGIHGAEFGARRIVVHERQHHQEQIGHTGNKHTEGNLTRRRHAFASPCQGGEDTHHQRGEDDDIQRIQCLPDFRGNLVGVDEVAGENSQRLTVLVERKPEEDGNSQNSKQSCHTLFDFGSHRFLFFCGVFCNSGRLFLRRLREHPFRGKEDSQRDYHGCHGREERIVYALVENGNIILAEREMVHKVVTCFHRGSQGFLELLSDFTVENMLVRERSHLGVINKMVFGEPPLTQ